MVVDGAVLLASEELKPCFAVEFAKQQRQKGGGGCPEGQQGQGGAAGEGEGGEQQRRVDYFSCGECRLNWLCAACAAHCHSGCRDVKPFMLNHQPTWGCCYCSKKRSRLGCKLAAAGEAGRGAKP